MANERKYFVLCENNCKFPAMTKEQILTAIEQAVSTGKIMDVDSGFITNIKEQNGNTALSFWVGTQAQYNALPEKVNDCFYIITDDTTKEDIENSLNDLYRTTENLRDLIINGSRYKDTVNVWASNYDYMLGELNFVRTAEFLNLSGELTFDTNKFTTGVEKFILMSSPLFVEADKKIGVAVPVLLIGDGLSENSGNSYGSAPIFIEGNDLTLTVPDITGIDKVKFYINVTYPINARMDEV
jgi:hypothetical protein